jgi:hypothetical protein
LQSSLTTAVDYYFFSSLSLSHMKMDPNQPVYAAEAYPVPPDIYAATAMPSAPPTAPPPMPTRQATVRLPEND